MKPSHLAKGVGLDLSGQLIRVASLFNEGQRGVSLLAGGRAIDDVYMYEIVIKYFYPLSNTSTFPRTRFMHA